MKVNSQYVFHSKAHKFHIIRQSTYRFWQVLFSSPLGDGLVLHRVDSKAKIGVIFVPEWGWVGSPLKILKILSIWSSFRPRVGMGWFFGKRQGFLAYVRFSSPLGDGLVLFKRKDIHINKKNNFRPRVGIGWFRKQPSFYNHRIRIFVPEWGWVGSLIWKRSDESHINFRPRVGMGWFDTIKILPTKMWIFVPEWGWVGSINVYDKSKLNPIFVPAWGWVGSQFSGHSITLNVRSFRPRLGMGWFEDGLMFSEVQQLFSSPLGDGLVLTNNGYINRNIIFSSPSGDGLVSDRRTKESIDWLFSSPGGVGLFHFTRTILLSSICFRPRLGMGWFMRKEKLITRTITIFVPAWGWVGSSMTLQDSGTTAYFRPRLGLGWFKKEKEFLTMKSIFVPEWGWVGSLGVGIHPRLLSFSSPSGDGSVH